MILENIHNMPATFVQVIKNLTYDPRDSDPLRISVTTLINPPRIRMLTIRHWDHIKEDISDHIWRVAGSAMHYVLAKAENAENLVEEKIELEIDGMTLVAKLDLYDSIEKSIEDWKFTSCWSAKFKEGKDWEPQLNCYAFLLKELGFEVKSLYINMLLKDWRKGESLKYDDYPKIPFVRKQIKLWDIDTQIKYIRERLHIYNSCSHLKDDELPLCTEEERWYSGESFAVMKNKNKIATKLFTRREDAKAYVATHNQESGNYYFVLDRPGIDMRCMSYCSCNKFCPFWKARYGKKE